MLDDKYLVELKGVVENYLEKSAFFNDVKNDTTIAIKKADGKHNPYDASGSLTIKDEALTKKWLALIEDDYNASYEACADAICILADKLLADKIVY